MARIFTKRAEITLEKGDLIHSDSNSEGHIYLRLDDIVYRSIDPSDLNFGDCSPTLDMEYFRDLSDVGAWFKWKPYSGRGTFSEETD